MPTDDRRFAIVEAIGEPLQNNLTYFAKLADLLDTPEAVEAMWRHMMTIDLDSPRFIPQNFPKTAARAEMMLDGGHSVYAFMQDFVTRDVGMTMDGKKLDTEGMFIAYNEWKDRVKDPRKVPTKRVLVKLLKDELGMASRVIKFSGTSRQGYVINAAEVEAAMRAKGMWDDTV